MDDIPCLNCPFSSYECINEYILPTLHCAIKSEDHLKKHLTEIPNDCQLLTLIKED